MTAASTSDTAWLAHFPALREITDPVGRRVITAAQHLRVPPGTTVFHTGDPCRNYLLVIDGSVRVQQTAPNGREIVLYRVGPGESCVLTTSCLLATSGYAAEGITEDEVEAVAIPAPDFHRAVAESPGFRQFVFDGFGQRLAELMTLIEEVAFGRLDARLAQRLLRLAGEADRVETTHQQLATEIGSAREVVSRQLKEFERRGWVALGRGHVDLRDRRALAALELM